MLPEQFSKAKIFIADDQKLHYFYLQKILHDAGYQDVTCLPESLKIREQVLEKNPDLLILDLIMPHLDGFQIMEQLHQYRENNYLPIIALSDDKGSDHRLKALQSGATDFLHKPYETPEILFRIKNMIEMRMLHLVVRDQNKILEEKVEARTRELKESQKEIIRRLAQAAEFRDNETGAHIIRISQYCALLGQAMGLNEEECELLLTASPLHDIGKIGIPDNILLKPGRLTDGEFEVMKTHALIGAQLLAGGNSPVMRLARTIALTHHERWDGSGYPNGLKGEEIPLIGQICSLCDVFDALISKRVYKDAWSLQDAAKIIIAEKGKQFKPELVDKFEQLLPEFIAIAKSHQDTSPVIDNGIKQNV
ncbi:MAG TPA: HD domain-containing phosphohydrolase [Candidatus Bathyarchaeia archaeon]|nr:HD domain-containing phosphohydrolase [Candidatus Bathyarchaeia archaeon]